MIYLLCFLWWLSGYVLFLTTCWFIGSITVKDLIVGLLGATLGPIQVLWMIIYWPKDKTLWVRK